jgi:dipeptidyl aminopeptidase/acylaminoacyl peptidase
MTSVPRSAAYSVAALALLASTSFTFAFSEPGQSDVTIFAPGPIPTTAMSSVSPAFTPDGATVYLGQQVSKEESIHIMSSQKKGATWSVPKIAPFSGQYRDLEPAFAPNGKYLIFASSRPITPAGAELEGHYSGKSLPGRGGNLWKVERTKHGWGTPEALPASINSNSSVFSPAVAGDGSLYFMRSDDGNDFHIYRSQMQDGKLQDPVLASFTDKTFGDYDPAVSPDESYIIFSSGRPPAPANKNDLFIAFHTPTGWGELIDLRSALSDKVYGIEARLSPDGNTLYFTNSRNPSGEEIPSARFIWKVDLTDLLKAHAAGKKSAASTSPASNPKSTAVATAPDNHSASAE